jgi:formate hydrogenlyase subunit 3/multisubunit Na+/H+ antiporter MnhD subunit
VLGALACLGASRPRQILALTIIISAFELGSAVYLWFVGRSVGVVTAVDELLFVDAFSAFHLIVLGLVFLLCSLFASVYFADSGDGHAFTRPVARRFGALWLGLFATMLLVLVSNNLTIMWVGMEATTLLTAFLISLQAQPAVARSDVEVLADLLGRDRLRANRDHVRGHVGSERRRRRCGRAAVDEAGGSRRAS